jgi:hypothetical protein
VPSVVYADRTRKGETKLLDNKHLMLEKALTEVSMMLPLLKRRRGTLRKRPSTTTTRRLKRATRMK